VSGTVTLLGSTSVTVTANTNFRTVIFGTNLWVYINGLLVAQQTLPSATTGQPGIGGTLGSGDGSDPDAFMATQIGQHWTTAPAAVSSGSIASDVYPTTASLKWPAVGPGSGPGILDYAMQRNSVAVANTTDNNPAEFLDTTVLPSTSYTYTIQTVDIHGNYSTGTGFSVTTPRKRSSTTDSAI
jgi:hypothetical protein